MYACIAILLAASVPPADVTAHGDAILAVQLPSGAIYSAETEGGYRIEPFAGNIAALGLVEAYRITGEERFNEGAEAWINWWLDHRGPEGGVSVHKGPAGAYEPVEEDAEPGVSAAAFLAAANMWRLANADRAFIIREKPGLWGAYRRILGTLDYDGLSMVDENAMRKRLRNNAWIYLGLDHARYFADHSRDNNWERRVYDARRAMRDAYGDLRGDDHLYPAYRVVREPEGRLASEADREALRANLSAAAIGPLRWSQGIRTYQAAREHMPSLAELGPEELFWVAMAGRRGFSHADARDAMSLLHAIASDNGSPLERGYALIAISYVDHKSDAPRRPGLAPRSRFIEPPPRVRY